jgi:predicted transposase YbfD/YdcC
LHGQVVKGRKTTRELCYGVSSIPSSPDAAERLHGYIRSHWGIENRVHHVRDRTYDEDRSQVRTETRPQVMATLRNAAISILRITGTRNIAKKTRRLNRKSEILLLLLGL